MMDKLDRLRGTPEHPDYIDPNDLPVAGPAFKWTTQPPRRPGVYVLRIVLGGASHAVNVFFPDGFSSLLRFRDTGKGPDHSSTLVIQAGRGAQWYGPLPDAETTPPEEA